MYGNQTQLTKNKQKNLKSMKLIKFQISEVKI